MCYRHFRKRTFYFLSPSFTFNETPTFEVGGPSLAWGGVPITVLGNVVSGLEGNRTIIVDGIQ